MLLNEENKYDVYENEKINGKRKECPLCRHVMIQKQAYNSVGETPLYFCTYCVCCENLNVKLKEVTENTISK
jgi:hypothetical protein